MYHCHFRLTEKREKRIESQSIAKDREMEKGKPPNLWREIWGKHVASNDCVVQLTPIRYTPKLRAWPTMTICRPSP